MHASNAKFEIEATLNGITIDLRPEKAKVEASIREITEPGANVTANVDDEHTSNALAPKDVNVGGRTIEPRDVHDWNAEDPMVSSFEFSAKVTVVSVAIPLNAPDAILVIDADKEMVCSAVVKNWVPILVMMLSLANEIDVKDVQSSKTLLSITETLAEINSPVILLQS